MDDQYLNYVKIQKTIIISGLVSLKDIPSTANIAYLKEGYKLSKRSDIILSKYNGGILLLYSRINDSIYKPNATNIPAGVYGVYGMATII